MKNSLTPQDPEFYNRSAADLARVLPGARLLTPEDAAVISMVEAFNGLERDSMKDDYSRIERKPGTICVTKFRGWPQLNVVGSVEGKPQLTWLDEVTRGGVELTSAAIVKEVAGTMNRTIADVHELFDFAIQEVDGKAVWKPNSPIRIVANPDVAPNQRRFLRHAGTAKNSAGVGVLSAEPNGELSPNALKAILDQEAARLVQEQEALKKRNKKVTGPKISKPEDLLEPANIAWSLRNSKILRRIISQLSHEED